MTDKELEEYDLHLDNSLFSKRRYWLNICQCHFMIPKNITKFQLVKMIWKKGREEGVENGKAERSREIKKLLEDS